MHELALVEDMVAAVTERVGPARVVRLQLTIGVLSGVVPESLRFCFEVCARGGALAAARLEIIEVMGRGRCRACGADVELPTPIALCACGSADLQVRQGHELRISEVEVA
jgi:hydrogenase nickel incorporation protein HypA/HybF